VLATLAAKGGKVAPNETLLKAMPPDRGAKHSHVGLVIRQLREKIEDDPRSPLLLTTERGVGYRLNISLAAAPFAAT
jgi:two-component system KDP operon response regulator KdpE